MTNTKIILVDSDDGSGDAILPLTDSLLEALGWKIGDQLNLEVRKDGSLLLSKAGKTTQTKLFGAMANSVLHESDIVSPTDSLFGSNTLLDIRKTHTLAGLRSF